MYCWSRGQVSICKYASWSGEQGCSAAWEHLTDEFSLRIYRTLANLLVAQSGLTELDYLYGSAASRKAAADISPCQSNGHGAQHCELTYLS